MSLFSPLFINLLIVFPRLFCPARIRSATVFQLVADASRACAASDLSPVPDRPPLCTIFIARLHFLTFLPNASFTKRLLE
jgi:hypothetical protein